MLRLILVILLICITNATDARFPRGQALEPAITTCDITTSNCTGLDAGTGLFTAATCNGIADDRNAFNSWNTFARATTTNTNGQLIELFIPSGKTCMFNSGQVTTNFILAGLKRSRLNAYGATLSSPSGNGWALGPAPAGTTGGGICQRGLDDAAGCSARTSTVSAGATSVNINTTGFSGSLATLCSRFTVGGWAAVTGFDLQGGYGHAYGFPPNPNFFDYVQIASTTNCSSTGQITFNSALKNGYLSTWPNWNSGSAVEADQGGPATIYALGPYWGGEATILGVTLDLTCNQCATKAIGRLVTFKDVTNLGSFCVWPSENKTITLDNFTGTNCNMEMDKIAETVIIKNSPSLRQFHTQSSSIDNIIIDNVIFSGGIVGTPKVATISNSTIPNLQLGPQAYGAPVSASCTNCVIGNVIPIFGLVEKGGPNNPGANIFFGVSGGVFSMPGQVFVTNLTNNGSGKVRLTVGTTSGWQTGTYPNYSSLFATCGGTSPCVGFAQITVVNGTTIDLPDYNFADITWTGTGDLYWSAIDASWGIPGTNMTASGFSAVTAGVPFFQVTGVTKSGNFINIATTLSGSYPNVPLASGKSFLQVQAPKWTCTNCTGTAQAVDFSGLPANIPIFSRTKRSYTNSTAIEDGGLWGQVTSITINVTTAYTGATNPLKMQFVEQGVTAAGAFAQWVGLIDLRTAGARVITPSGVTCNGVTGAGTGCGTDSGLALPDPGFMFGATLNLSKPNGSPVDQPWAMDYDFIMNQGVVP